ncbi:MAG TPA: YtxH domain-containing protein [Nitrospira sp.]|nr:YtxH domain-containing protein [Nitrospira sp.]
MANERDETLAKMIMFFAGCMIGGIAGLLYAPQSGVRTRRRLTDFAEDVKEKAEDLTDEASVAVKKAVDRGRRFVNT